MPSSTPIDRTIDGLTNSIASFERHANSWSTGLYISTAVLAVAIGMEIWADWLEFRADKREGRPTKFRHLLMFAAGIIVAITVAAEGFTQWRASEAETRIRGANNRLETLLRDKADCAAIDA